MNDTLTKHIGETLRLPEEALAFSMSLMLAQLFPNKYILETTDSDFDIDLYAEGRHCAIVPDRHSHSQLQAEWRGKGRGGRISPRNGVFDVRWRGETFKVVRVQAECSTLQFVIATDPAVAKQFFAVVCRASSEASGKILSFSRGFWRRDRELLKAISATKIDTLVLPAETLKALVSDIEGFFEAEDLYKSLNVPWKRGVLMMGPPGNGKTHAIKAMVNRTGKACLYVKSLVPDRGTIHGTMQEVFRKAREAAPCILVLEDLDALVDNKNRSLFLNEMDGFAANHGILTVATTNHPERLDPAMLERPSRFDRKITFHLPGPDERSRFLKQMLAKREISEEEIASLCEETDGFTFAYLKELCLSGVMMWIHERSEIRLSAAMATQVEALRKQMTAEPKKVTQVEDDDEDDEES
jgi:AAA+ superfamily predicted ATPase